MSAGHRMMFDALGEVFNICFEERAFGNDTGIAAWILQGPAPELIQRIAHCDLPCYTVIHRGQFIPCGESSIIEFTRHAALLSVLSGRQINTDEAIKLMALPQWSENMTVLASKAGATIWALQEAGANYHHFAALPIPELNDGEPLFQYFHGKQFLQLLPLFLFLRALTNDKSWEPPPLQACFMFDDPNLHWPTYGFIDFAKVLQDAILNNYHVSFATIPLDTWFVHMPTAALFKQHSERLSLLIHGNDHITEELARAYSEEERIQILLQALRRIGAFERRSGIEVSRVMAPPHGACSESALREMAHMGFEAAGISKGSLRCYNKQAPWLRTLGMMPSDIIGGLPVFPRFPFSGSCYNSILLAALLHQPIIPMGHHHDIAEGLKLFADLSGFVNSLGNVFWADMKLIARSHYARKFDGRILRIRMLTRRIEVCVPEGVNQVLVDRSWLKGRDTETVVWKTVGENSEWRPHHPNESFPVLPCQKIEIVAELPASTLNDAKNFRNFHLWPVVRRQLTEARDRLTPVIRRISAAGAHKGQ